MKVKVTFECEVADACTAWVENLIRYNFAHVDNYKLEEIEDTEDGNNTCV